MTTATTPPTPPTPEGLKTEAAELTADIKEATAESAEAREAGNTARADKLDAAIAKQQTTLEGIAASLKALTERPFHPAPGDGETTPPPATPAGETPPETTPETPPAKPKRRHLVFGDRWNQE